MSLVLNKLGTRCVLLSTFSNVTDNMQKVCISISPGIPLRGDILIKCYHKKNKAGQREIMWGCQFHTCAISHNSLVFSKNELDSAITGRNLKIARNRCKYCLTHRVPRKADEKIYVCKSSKQCFIKVISN